MIKFFTEASHNETRKVTVTDECYDLTRLQLKKDFIEVHMYLLGSIEEIF